MDKYLVVSNYVEGREWKLDVINMKEKKLVKSYPVEDWYDYDQAFTAIEEHGWDYVFNNAGSCPYGHELDDRGEKFVQQLLDKAPITMEVKELGKFFQEMYRIGYCMDYDTFCGLMHGSVENAYTMGKWQDMQKNFAKWFSFLDEGEAYRYVAYCRNKIK